MTDDELREKGRALVARLETYAQEHPEWLAELERRSQDMHACVHEWSAWGPPTPPDSPTVEAERTCMRCGACDILFNHAAIAADW